MTSIGTVTGQEIKKNRDGSIAVRLLQVQISNPSDIQTVQYISASGEDSAPINGDKVQIFSIGPAFQFAVACEDQNNVASVGAGEKKLFSRDSSGAIAAFINFLAGGNLELNGNSDTAVRFAALNTALQLMLTSLNADIVSAGGSGTTSLDISAAESATVKLL